MRLVQSVRTGDLRLEETPAPSPGPTQVLVATRASLISAGTERSLRSLASSSMVAKARARPDLVRQVIRRARTTGIKSTADAVRARLTEDMPLGYSASGVVASAGEAVAGLRPGQRVATAGAPHADMQVVAGNLVAVLPDAVSFEEGAFATVGSIALNGFRLGDVGAGSRVLVVGLGLVGQLAARIGLASGAFVAGIEPESWKRDVAATAGVASFSSDDAGWESARRWTGSSGADAVIVTAASKSSVPMRQATMAARERGVVVVVGDVGMDLDRRHLYERELTLRVARSYGPGRYDPSYEDLGVDYPQGFVRWTAQRNMAAVLELIAAGRLSVSDLVTHRYAFSEAPSAYETMESRQARYLGIVLEYGDSDRDDGDPEAAPPAATAVPESDALLAGLIGAGRFAQDVLVPMATRAGFDTWTKICSATGAGANRVAAKVGSAEVVSNPSTVIEAEDTPIVFIATRHDSHATFAAAALRAGKHVFCEKPLALSEDELDDVAKAAREATGALLVGFNRRWSAPVADATAYLGSGGPLQVVYRVSAGPLPEGHWLGDRRMGGRLLGEACHFVDTCSAIVGSHPATVTTATSGRGELLLDQDFTLLLGYDDGSQAAVVYSSSSSARTGKERIEIMGRERLTVIDDFQKLDMYGPDGHASRRYRPADKGHRQEFQLFADLIRDRGNRDEVVDSAIRTSRAMLAAVESAMTGTLVRPSY